MSLWKWEARYDPYHTFDCTYTGSFHKPGIKRELGARILVWDTGQFAIQVFLWWRVLDIRRIKPWRKQVAQ